MKYLVIWLLLLTSTARAGLPELQIRQLAEGVFLHTSFQLVPGYGLANANGLVVIEDNNAYLIDTPWSEQDTARLLAWLAERHLTLKGSLSTHFHEDRSAGVGYLNHQGISTYASFLTNRKLKETGRTQTSVSFDHQQPFWWNDTQIQVFYPGAGHTEDNLVVWLPQSHILFGGCLIRSGNAKGLGNIGDAMVKDWAASVTRVLSTYPEVEQVIPGHGKTGDSSLLYHTRDLAVAAQSR